jgi:hypothetical protein
MVAARADHGLEFVRAWDRHKLSIIAMLPFVFSVVFAVAWIGVSIGKFKVDAQVAVQTAFTVAGFIVTAGKVKVQKSCFLLVLLLIRCRSYRCTSHSLIRVLRQSIRLDG